VSIVKVAALAGVSKSTVSMVINNNPTVVPETASKVRLAMQELGYTPRPREQRGGPKPNFMYPGRVLNLVLVTIGIPREVFCSPLYTNVIHGILCGASDKNHRLEIHHIFNPADFNAESIFRSGADGFLLFGRGESAAAAKAFRDYPCVSLMGSDKVRDGCDWISYDDVAAGQLAADYLFQQGHRECAFIGDATWRRGQAYAERLKALGVTVRNLDAAGVVRADSDSHDVDQRAVDDLVSRLKALTPRPTGLFVWQDMVTAALYPALYNQSLIPGRDITVVTCNNEWPYLLGLRPRPAVIDIQGAKIGSRAVDQLLWRMQHRREPTGTVLLTPELVLSK